MNKSVLYYHYQGTLVPINLQDVLFIEVKNNNSIIHTTSKAYPSYCRLHQLEARLPEEDFCRIHRSYIVNLHKISSIHRDRVLIGHRELPVGTVFYRELVKKLSIIT